MMLAHAPAQSLARVSGPWDVYALLWPEASRLRVERAWAMVLGAREELLERAVIGRGSAYEVDVDLGRLYEKADRARSRYLVVSHNHITGDARPSSEDGRLTHAAWDGARRRGLVLLDHVIVADGQFYSFAANRWKGGQYYVNQGANTW
jgi:DNA repair protein RadC